jgi:TPP-dependent pyruvate/acetoin dehydrogenase alpha subunit
VTAGRIADRATAFDVPGIAIDGNDVTEVRETAAAAVARARGGGGPTLIEAVTYRQRGHEEGEEAYGAPARPPEEVSLWLSRDPLERLRAQLTDAAGVAPSELEAIEERERERVAEAVRFAEASPLPGAGEALEDVYAIEEA